MATSLAQSVGRFGHLGAGLSTTRRRAFRRLPAALDRASDEHLDDRSRRAHARPIRPRHVTATQEDPGQNDGEESVETAMLRADEIQRRGQRE
jgi:hypothetical protein